MTSRFPKVQLENHVGPESGDWAVMKTRVNDHLVYTVGHRRGGSIHTYLSTHGLTKRGRDQAHREDVDEDGCVAPYRKCPKILNDWTQMQPWIDKSNRFRQQILAIEERFRTTQFPFRLATTVIVGMAIASAYVAHQYHNLNRSKEQRDEGDDVESFRQFVEEVSYLAMTNTYDLDQSGHPPEQERQGLHAGGDVRSTDPDDHIPVSITSLKRLSGFGGGAVQRCSVCKARTSYACSNSNCFSKQFISPICNSTVTYGKKAILKGCGKMHARHPDKYAVCCASKSKSVAARRRWRNVERER